MEPATLNAFGGLVVGASDAVTREMTQATGLDEVTITALLAVHTRPGRSVAALAELLGTTHSGAVRITGRLQRAALVSRGPGPDGRTAALHTTALGEKQSAAALEARRAVLAALLDRLTPARADALADVVGDVAPALATTRGEAQRVCRLCEHTVCRGERCPVGGHL